MIRWAAVDPATGELRGEGELEQLPAASTIKLFVASAFWRSELDPDELAGPIPPAGSAGVAEYLSPRARLTLGDLATLMLAVSDNAATNVLLDRLGFDAVAGELARLGLERTEVRRPMMTAGLENLTCAADLARGLAALADHAEIRRGLGLASDSYLPYLLPAGVTVLSKSGELDSVRHEVALLESPSRRLTVATLSSPAVAPDALAFRSAHVWRQWI